jgi:curved DNA-binding protein
MNPHSVLGVAADATPEQIKSAYRKMAMQHHPDRNGGSEEASRKFQEIQDAYDMLRTDKPRKQQSHQHQHQNHHEFHMNMHDMFNHFFHSQQTGNPAMQAVCDITLEQAFQGCSVNFSVNGKSVVVDIPAGIDHGQTIRIAGGAGQQNPNYPPGDLHVIVRMREHAYFQRHGMTLLTKVRVNLLDLLTGCEVEIPTINGGKKTVKVPENSNPTSTVLVEKEGMNVTNSNNRGDMIIHFEVEYPKFNKKQLQSLRKMKKS